MEKQIKLFLDFLQNSKKLSDNTLQSYRRDITQYEDYINKSKLDYLKIQKVLNIELFIIIKYHYHLFQE